MLHYDASRAEVLIHTFREGVLSPVGHDLELIATALTLDVDESTGTIEARIDARSLKLRGAVVDGRVVPGRISAGDTRTIEGNTYDDVLTVSRYPEIRFTGKLVRDTPSGGHVVEGTLTVRGVSRPLAFSTTRVGDLESAEIPLEQTDFGIKPFRAMLGALKVRSRIVVKLRISRSA
jgi:polyisoprenoid-binding protein YceI